MAYWKFETVEQRKAREAREKAFWDDPDVFYKLAIAEEDLPEVYRGGPDRRFKSPNVIDLLRIKKKRAAA
jgi:hypothetical protein